MESALPECAACGEPALRMLCEAQELAGQAARLERFHGERLRELNEEQLAERATFTQDDPAHLLECARCGLVIRWPRPAKAELRRTYADDAYAPERLDEMLASQRALFQRKLPQLAALLGKPGRVLEIGSFVGGFLAEARAAGWDAVGLDPGRQLVRACRRRGLRVIEGTFEDLAARDALFSVDCIAIWNTFDQLADPRTTLALAAVSLRPGGILALRVPHGACFAQLLARWRSAHAPDLRRLWEGCLAWNNLFSFPYLFGYGLESLLRLVTPFGFELASVQGDLLPPLAGEATAEWARAEEQCIKSLQRRWIQAQGPGRAAHADAPWLDVYWTRRG
jgi:SAM-dependent methyltransferase